MDIRERKEAIESKFNPFQIFVGNVPLGAKELKPKLETLFSRFGIVIRVYICTSKRNHKKGTSKSKGYAFISFKTALSVERAIQFQQPLKIGAIRVFCEEVKSKHGSEEFSRSLSLQNKKEESTSFVQV